MHFYEAEAETEAEFSRQRQGSASSDQGEARPHLFLIPFSPLSILSSTLSAPFFLFPPHFSPHHPPFLLPISGAYPLIQLGSAERCKLLSGVRAEPGHQTACGAFCAKKVFLVVAILTAPKFHDVRLRRN